MLTALHDALHQVLASLVTRGKVRRARIGPQRTVLRATVLKGEVKEGVELLLPSGVSAVPLGGDVLLLQVGTRRDHLVALVEIQPSASPT